MRAIVLLHRYSGDITRIAQETLGAGLVDNRAIQLLLTVARTPGLSPGELASRTGVSRSVVSRSLVQLTDAGLVSRQTARDDGRSARVSPTARGRRQIGRFASGLGDYFHEGAPVVKESLHELSIEITAQHRHGPPDPIAVAYEMSAAGAAYTEDVDVALAPFGVVNPNDRWTLALVGERGVLRPSELAAELGLTTGGVSLVLTRLQTRGLIHREQGSCATDRRAVLIVLSARGERAAKSLIRAFSRHSGAILQSLGQTL